MTSTLRERHRTVAPSSMTVPAPMAVSRLTVAVRATCTPSSLPHRPSHFFTGPHGGLKLHSSPGDGPPSEVASA